MRTAKELPRNKAGQKLYPVCSWEKNQHKLYNAHDRIMVAIYEATDAKDHEALDGLYDALEKCERAIDVFNGCVIDGTVFATWEDSKSIKDFVWAYNARH